MIDKKPRTRQQVRAQIAYKCISRRINAEDERQKNENIEYSQLAKRFPPLVHNCGLAQALAFVQAKEKDQNIGEAYISHLSKVMGLGDNIKLGDLSRNADLKEYQRLTREAIESAAWIKRYAEALLE
jgi:CRISPR-associated protein Cmr5